MQLVVEDFANKRMPVYGTEAEWYDYWLEWAGMIVATEINSLGINTFKWNKPVTGRCDFPFCFRKDTLVVTQNGDIPIKDIKVGDLVLTRKGYKKVVWSGITREHADLFEFKTELGSVFATREHRFWNGKSFRHS